jgi:hypothetical protein
MDWADRPMSAAVIETSPHWPSMKARVHDIDSREAVRATAQQLRHAAVGAEPGVLTALSEEEQPARLRARAARLVGRSLHFLDQVVSWWGVKRELKRRHNQTFEGVLRSAVGRGVQLGDLAAFARLELDRHRERLAARSPLRSVLILECVNAISAVRITAAALQLVADRREPEPSIPFDGPRGYEEQGAGASLGP